MKKIVVLGSGMVGHVIALDMADKHLVTVVDKNSSSLDNLPDHKNITKQTADVTYFETLKNITADADLVITALPGFMAFNVVKQLIELGKNIADISFYPEDALQLNEFAQKNNCTVIVDCGVAPGMSNFILGYHTTKMKVEEFICYVGGLPFERTFPFEYKAPFSPIDVIEEYTRPARLKEHGKIVTKPALSEPEFIDAEGIGTLEAFNTDGLRSLLYTMDVPNMKEKTLRYPGHIQLIKALQASGFFDNKEVDIHSAKIKPIELTTHLLKEAWKLKNTDDEFTFMRIVVKGKENGQQVQYTYNLLDRRDFKTGFSSMSRTTGFACTAMANLILDKKFAQKGVFPPELVAINDDTFRYVMNYLEARNVHYNQSIHFEQQKK